MSSRDGRTFNRWEEAFLRPGIERPGTWNYGRRQRRSDASGPLVIGLVLIVIGAYFLARQFIPEFNWGLIWPLLVIAGGLLLIVAAFTRTRAES